MAEVKGTAVERVCSMEAALDAVLAALEIRGEAAFEESAVQEHLRQLADYMDSGLWLADYQRDEAGGFPRGLKRGVLAQDTLYDLLSRLSGE